MENKSKFARDQTLKKKKCCDCKEMAVMEMYRVLISVGLTRVSTHFEIRRTVFQNKVRVKKNNMWKVD